MALCACGEFEAREGKRDCFRCHVKTVNLGFTYGKEDFHGPTVRERLAEEWKTAKASGEPFEPKHKGSWT